MQEIHREITQLKPEDSFLVYDRVKDDFDFPLHFHPEIELNYISNGAGVRRTVGDHMGAIDDIELVLVGPNLPHVWELHKCTSKEIHEITVHIDKELLDTRMLSRHIFKHIKDMISRSSHGILFSRETTIAVTPRLEKLFKISGIEYFTEFISILQFLAVSQGQQMLSTASSEIKDFDNSSNTKKVYEYIQKNYGNKITLDEISDLVHMSPVSFNRFIKKRTGRTFVAYVNSTRISHASRMLLETDMTIGEISYKCGFNNVANFNRVFKRDKNCTPSEYKEQFLGIKRVL